MIIYKDTFYKQKLLDVLVRFDGTIYIYTHSGVVRDTVQFLL